MNLTEYLAEYPRLLADPEIPGLVTRLKDRIAKVRGSWSGRLCTSDEFAARKAHELRLEE